jgi:acyl-CoA thioesterase I
MRFRLSLLLVAVGLVGCTTRVPAGYEDLPGVHLAAIGDSITYGYGLTTGEAWPTRLQELLGDEYAVVNFGHNGASALEAGQWPYSGLPEYDDALNFAPEIVISMLGTNDSREGIWDPETYRQEYGAMLDTLAELDSTPAVHLALPPPAWENDFPIRGDTIEQEVLPAIQELATDRGWPVIDANTPFDDEALMQDGVHPTAEGAQLIAETVAEAL